MMVFTDHAQITWNYTGDDLWSASCCALLLAESNSNHLKEEQNANKGTLPFFSPKPLIVMCKDAGKDKKKYFLILQMNRFNLDKFLALLTVLGQFVISPESISHDSVCPVVSCTLLQNMGISFMNYLDTGGAASFGILMT